MPEHTAPWVVIDTNCVLDLWVFQDPGVAPLLPDLHAGRVRWCATAAMREELARVLDYPAIARRLQTDARAPQQVLHAFDSLAHLLPAAPHVPVRCRDPDDQIFINLAAAQRAALISKDGRVTGLARRLRPWGVHVSRSWPLPTPATP